MNLFYRIKRRLRWEWHKAFDKIYRHCARPPHVMSYTETIDYILSNRASIARFGDGELYVIYGKALGFQKKDNKLGEKLREVLQSDVESLLVCIPDGFDRLERYIQVERNFWESHNYFNRRRWYRLLNKSTKYGNAFISRFYAMELDKDLAKIRLEMLRKLWNKRDLIIVEGSETKMGIGNDLFDNANSVRRIVCPARDAFGRYNDILKAILEIPRNDESLFILALGPTATVLAADIHKNGLQALDLGHMDIEYEWFKMGAKQKVPISGKFSNEAAILGLADSAVSGSIDSHKYLEQIICKIE